MTRNHRYLLDYGRHRYPQLGSERCACGRVARDMRIDAAKHTTRPVCYVCSGYYDRNLTEKQVAEQRASRGHFHSRAA